MDDRVNSVHVEIRDLKDRIRADQLALLLLILLMIVPIVFFLLYIFHLISEPVQLLPDNLDLELMLAASTLWILPFLYLISIRQQRLITDRLNLEWLEQGLGIEAMESLHMKEEQADLERWRKIVSGG